MALAPDPSPARSTGSAGTGGHAGFAGSGGLRDPFRPILLLLTVLAIAPIWLIAHFPSQDGPSHLYNTFVLRHLGDASYAFGDYFEASLAPVPNWLATASLYAFSSLFSMTTSEKLLLTLYVAGMAAAWHALVRSTQGGPSPLVLLGPLLAASFPLYKGFYSFCLSLPLFLAVLTAAWIARRRTERAGAGTFLLLNGLLVATYFGHMVSFGIAALGAWLLLSWPHAADTERDAPTPLARAARSAALLSPAFVLPAWFLLRSTGPSLAGWDPAASLFYLLRAEWLVFFSPAQRLAGAGLALLVAILTARTLRLAIRGETRLGAKWAFAVLALVTALACVAAPRGTAGGWYLNERLAIYPVLAIVPFLAPLKKRYSRGLVACAILVLTAFQWTVTTREHVRTSRILDAYLELTESVPRGRVLLPLAWETEAGTLRVAPLLHAAGHYAIASGGIYAADYEARTGYFQVRFRDDVLSVGSERFRSGFTETEQDRISKARAVFPSQREVMMSPETVDIGRYAQWIDILVTWNLRESVPEVERGLSEEYEMSGEAGRLRLYRRKADGVFPAAAQ